MLVRVLSNALDSTNNNNGLTDDIIKHIRKSLDRNLNHSSDRYKIPISD
jgi:hypothetical protein